MKCAVGSVVLTMLVLVTSFLVLILEVLICSTLKSEIRNYFYFYILLILLQ